MFSDRFIRPKSTGMMRTKGTPISVLLAASAMILFAQPAGNPGDALLDVLVWGTHMSIDPAAYPPALRAEVELHLRRSKAYVTKREIPPYPEGEMVQAAQANYERRLVAISNDREAPALAAAYVDNLRPCYEWEGFHDCPEREAEFADEYQAAHPNGPFSEYLPLLAAHRWLCTAEGYDYEQQPTEAARSRRNYQQRVSTAQKSRVPLIRTAAERLAARGRCHVLR
jgi:hypothetical protein